MKKQSDLEKLKEILENQVIKNDPMKDYDDVRTYRVIKTSSGFWSLTLESLSISCVFNRNGRFVGIYNWKE